MFDENDLIDSYSRAQAIDDGVLIDVTETAIEAGLKYPVALTTAAWCRCVSVPPYVHGQDEEGRLWDVLWMLRFAIGKTNTADGALQYQLLVRNDTNAAKLVTLKAVCGPNDDGSPCITVMLPNED